MNRTLLLSLISKCQQLLLTDMMAGSAKDNQTSATDIRSVPSGSLANTTTTTTTSAAAAASANFDQRKSYDNAYFYILFVMLFYFLLAGMLFKNFLRSDKKDPYAEFMGSEPASTAGPGKFNPGLASERLDFEEESSLC